MPANKPQRTADRPLIRKCKWPDENLSGRERTVETERAKQSADRESERELLTRQLAVEFAGIAIDLPSAGKENAEYETG